MGAGKFWDQFRNSFTEAEVCKDHRVCNPGYYKVRGSADAFGDALCRKCSRGKFTSTEDEEDCQAIQSCDAGKYVVTDATSSSDRVCGECMPESIKDDEDNAGFTKTANNRNCRMAQKCLKGEEEAEAPTTSTDRQCKKCDQDTFTDKEDQASCQVWRQ